MSIEIKIPAVAESVTEAMVAEWYVEDGAFVELDQPICSLETDKASMDLSAETSGIISLIAEEDHVAQVGEVIATLIPGEDSAPRPTAEVNTAAPTPAQVSAPVTSDSYASGHPSPAAEVILAGKGIDASSVPGSGKDGRITKEDALAAKAPVKEAPKSSTRPATKKADAATAKNLEEGQSRKKMSMMRRKLAERLVGVKNRTAMLTTFNEVDMSAIMNIRKLYKDQFRAKYDVNLGFMSFFTKACSLALQEWPGVNSMIDGNEVVSNVHNHIGIAVSTPKGLVVPVLNKVEQMGFSDIEQTILGYAKKARDGKISIEDMLGGTFTITNGGVFGSMLSTPIINPPQSAILGMHNIVERAVVVNGEIVVRPIMYLALSYDHRVVDGKESVSFLKMVKDILEDPTRYFLGL
jgi:2-oxoglutarate dehydrogenase E2 component (dihydrolipoamide succinyltransferase)